MSSVVFLKESKKKWLMIYIMFLFPCGGQSPDSRGGSARLWSRIRFSCRRLVFCANNDYRHKSFFLFTVPLFINSAIRCFNNPRLLSQPFLFHLLTTVIIAFPFLQSVKSCEKLNSNSSFKVCSTQFHIALLHNATSQQRSRSSGLPLRPAAFGCV